MDARRLLHHHAEPGRERRRLAHARTFGRRPQSCVLLLSPRETPADPSSTCAASGIRFGSSEIYEVIDTFAPGATTAEFGIIEDSLVVGQKIQGGSDERVVLFVKLVDGKTLDDKLLKEIKLRIRNTFVFSFRAERRELTLAVFAVVLRATCRSVLCKSRISLFVLPPPTRLDVAYMSFYSIRSTGRRSRSQSRSC